MEELLKKQVLFQKIMIGLLTVLVITLLSLVVILTNYVGKMTASMEQAVEKIEQIDTDAINETISTTQGLLNNVDDLSKAIEDVTGRVEEFDTWMNGLGIFK